MRDFQELFDTAAKGILKQGVPSINANNECQHLGQNGTSCGVGQLLANDEMRQRWDREGWGTGSLQRRLQRAYGEGPEPKLLADFETCGMAFDAPTIDFLRKLQRAHDEASRNRDFIANFKANMRNLAFNYNLNTIALSAPAA